MGFLDKFKKKKSEEGESASEEVAAESSDEEVSTEDSPDDSGGDPFLDESDMADDDDVSLDDIDIDSKQSEEAKPKAGMDPDKKKKLIIFFLLLALFFLLIAAGGVWYYLSNRLYPEAAKVAVKFVNTLNNGKFNLVYNMHIDDDYKADFSDADFRYIIEGSSFLFEEIDVKKVKPVETSWKEKGKNASLVTQVAYVDKSEGELELHFIERERGGKVQLKVVGFEMRSPERIEREHSDAYRTAQEFLKTFDKDKLNVFKEFIHPHVKEKWAKNATVKMLQLHSRLAESGFVGHQFDEESVEMNSNVQLTFFGKSRTKLGNDMRGQITVFYTKGTWYVIGVNFKPL